MPLDSVGQATARLRLSIDRRAAVRSPEADRERHHQERPLDVDVVAHAERVDLLTGDVRRDVRGNSSVAARA